MTQDAQEKALSRWSVLAAALLIAMIGFFSGGLRESQIERAVHASDKSDGQQFSRRDPIRALVVIERRDAGAGHWQNSEGALSPSSQAAGFSRFRLAASPAAEFAASSSEFWPAPLPRAPPAPAAII